MDGEGGRESPIIHWLVYNSLVDVQSSREVGPDSIPTLALVFHWNQRSALSDPTASAGTSSFCILHGMMAASARVSGNGC